MIEDQSAHHPSGVLSGPEISAELKAERLIVMPNFSTDNDLQKANSIDLRLGSELILMRKGETAALTFEGDVELSLERFYERIYVGLEDDFMLHPGELVLGATLEYIVLPNDLMAYIVGRSSWGRLGLVIATAIAIHPGYRGCPTLELVNVGNIPIRLFPGSPIPIAQLVLHTVGPGQESYGGKYSEHMWVGPTGPDYSRIHMDGALQAWVKYRNKAAPSRNPESDIR